MKPVALKHHYDRYTGGGDLALVNGIRGTKTYDDGNWQGYEQNDLEATVDLGRVVPLKKISSGFLQNTRSWIFLPTEAEFAVSIDGRNFERVGRFSLPIASSDQDVGIRELEQPLMRVPARFVRVFARNLGTCPDWHVGKGGKAWLFVDEIVVE